MFMNSPRECKEQIEGEKDILPVVRLDIWHKVHCYSAIREYFKMIEAIHKSNCSSKSCNVIDIKK
jgi:hypothetical protein